MNAESECKCGHVPALHPNRDCERCCLVWFAHTTTQMRAAQSQFFKSRKGSDLEKARRLEAIVDHAITRLSNVPTQSELF